MHRYGPHRTRIAIQNKKALMACFMLGVVVAAAPASAGCGCADDGHGVPRLAGVAAQLDRLSALIDERLAATRKSGTPAQARARRQP